MSPSDLKSSLLARTLSDVMTDVSDLVRKEIQLARAEIGAKLSAKMRAMIWLGGAALFGLFAMLFALQALALGIASFGIALHWACLIVAALVAGVAAVAFFRGRADLEEEMTPGRTINQVKQDIATVKEQLS